MSPKVSVIVPVYHVAKYIERCARSLFEQTLDDLEILFVDDCTPDNSVEIIKCVLTEYPSRRSLTQIIKMPSNSGSAAVRREGIIQAKGDYLIHCDGDDWVDIDLYEKMYNQAIAQNADIVVCDRYMEYKDSHILRYSGSIPERGKDIIKLWYANTYGMFCWNKLVKRSIHIDYDILPWIGLNMWEDNGLMTRVFYYCNKVSYIQGSYYHYNRANVNAMTAGYGEKQVMQMVGVAQNLTDFFKSKPDYADFEKTVLAFQFLAKLNFITDKFSGLRKYNQLFPDSERIISELDKNAFSTKGRLRFYFVKYHLAWLFVLLFKIKNVIAR